MNKIIYSIAVMLLTTLTISAQNVLITQPVSDDIKTIVVALNNDTSIPPIMRLNSTDRINISFDRLNIEEPRLRYRIVHCDAQWQPSPISTIEYMDGFNDQPIDDYRFSENTTVNYINYHLQLPNNNFKPKLSGNYAVVVTDDFDPDNTLLTVCFSVVEPKVQLKASVSGNTDVDFNKAHQQLTLEITHPAISFRDPMNELATEVRQNNRSDNVRWVKPTFVQANRLIFEHDRALIFEAGNEYRRFETVGRQSTGQNVAHTFFRSPYHNAELAQDRLRADQTYHYDKDQNGRFTIRYTQTDDSNIAADYALVHFSLLVSEKLPTPTYIYGGFAYGKPIELAYNSARGEYHTSALLKQGAYNYIYVTPAEQGEFSAAITEGNFYETENEYLIKVYYRQPGKRYDQLIGWQRIVSDNK